ncbi:MAG TPA: hypothetical protein PK573_07405 [Spirochaetota bacterium]|nr:hypothetical protein [Spirochaetota bacterium]HRZ28480.1 hypothetical protein [Spirochaetota bacterium]HSA14619.1 hypothetical protein [Spirochaetota bacterium]
MNIDKYPELKPGKKYIKRYYVAIMLWIVGRAIQAACRLDKEVIKEFSELPEKFTFSLGVLPDGPFMIIGKDDKGRAKYMGWNKGRTRFPLEMNIKSLEAAIKVFTFQEGTATAFARERFIVDGDLGYALAVVRVLNIIEVYLLPKIITKLAVKRYPRWSEFSPLRKWVNRILIYIRAFTF